MADPPAMPALEADETTAASECTPATCTALAAGAAAGSAAVTQPSAAAERAGPLISTSDTAATPAEARAEQEQQPHPHQHGAAQDGQGQQQRRRQQSVKWGKIRMQGGKPPTPRLAKLEDAEDLEDLYGSEISLDDEDALVARLMSQLQGLSHKQQRLYGIWDETTPDGEGGRRAFVARWRERHADRRAMVTALQDPTVPPQERMALRAAYILRWRKILFSCPGCWLLPGLCVCGRMARFTPQRTKVLVHAHHGEWGSASNSGSILPTSLDGSEMLLAGHPDHDKRMRELLDDPTRTVALLWPGADSLLPEQLKAIADERTEGRITVVALDATWSNARRMQGWFPKGTLTVKLPPESTLKENKLSLLRPVRRYRGDLESGRVSTVEAVASLLYELEGDEPTYRGLLDNLKIKVDACRLQKNRSMVYDTRAPEERSERHRWRGQQQQQPEQDAEGPARRSDGGVAGGDAEIAGEGGASAPSDTKSCGSCAQG